MTRQNNKKLIFNGLVMALAIFATTAFAPKSSTAQITVSKNPDDNASFTTIQAAVNAAAPNQVITILDNAVYNEQVTIDGRDQSPWSGVTGGKNGITIRYAPPAGTPINSNFARPTIMWQDKANRSPKNQVESLNVGDQPGESGNFETCGALRVIRAQGVTIEGIAIDGGGAAPFGWDGVWGGKGEFQHGNAAIAVVISGGTVVRNCDIKNAYIGVYVNDRNTGGVFANPNPEDNDVTVPLSGFGMTGGHLAEHNRVHNNSLGFYFESGWDLSSTVRCNLIYNNYHTSTLNTTSSGGLSGIPNGDNMVATAIMFKDWVFTPIAVYNNTFYQNANNLLANWKVGAASLIFNNIFSQPYGEAPHYMSIDLRFPNRMHNSVFSADGKGLLFNSSSQYTPGALISGSTQMTYPIPQSANVRWLEMTQRTEITGTYNLFESTDPANAKFLWPKWDDTLVQKFIKNKGWADAGIRNSDGNIADLGAISSAGNNNTPLRTIACIKPTNVVRVSSGTNATAEFYLNVEAGSFNNPAIKFLRWVASLPNACKDSDPSLCNWAGDGDGQSAIEIPAGSISNNITPANSSINVGTNALSFTLPSAVTANFKYGFIEMVIEGIDADGNKVTTDVGFMPYREITHVLEVCVSKDNGATWNCGTGTTTPSVPAGEAVQLRVTAKQRTNAVGLMAYNPAGGALPVTYRLLSHPAAKMWQPLAPAPSNPLDSVANLATGTTRTQTYTVYFTRAGDETILAAGQYGTSTDRIPLLGSLRLKVTDGAPDKVVFVDPVPKSQLNNPSRPNTISVTYNAAVQVRDKYDNPVTNPVDVSLKSLDVNKGDVNAPAKVETVGGIATFVVRVTNGKIGDIFELEASISNSSASKAKDTAVLRIGRAETEGLRVLYQNTVATNGSGDWQYDYDAPWEGALVGERRQVWIKLVNNAGDTVITSKSAFVCVAASPPIKFFASADGAGSEASQYLAAMTNGVAAFWISSDVAVDGVTLTASAKTTADCGGTSDNSISSGSNSGIRFSESSGNNTGPFTLTYSAGPNGSINGSVSQTVEFGGSGEAVIAVPNSGYIFEKWSDGNTNAERTDKNVIADINVTATFTKQNTPDSTNNGNNNNNEDNYERLLRFADTVIAGIKAGANPVIRVGGVGSISFYRVGGEVKSGRLRIYDVLGNSIAKIEVADRAGGNLGKRRIGSWGLADSKGRPVPAGAYLVRGVLTRTDGVKERVSFIVNVNN